MKFIYPILCLILIALLSCRKEKIKAGNKRLPNETQRGRGIFGCYIDDQTYIARKQPAVVYNETDGYLNLSNDFQGRYFRMFVYNGLYTEGIYAFDSTGEEFIYRYPYGVKGGELNYLEITRLDTDEEVVSGKFELDVFSNVLNKKIKIRDGRFDLKMEVIH
ncbi:MAG: hypothetical protein HUJ25_03085 [Crocinitomicaceae bacterium]|nr:hypothetical protein [Crocinitomicaceae bacterium]